MLPSIFRKMLKKDKVFYFSLVCRYRSTPDPLLQSAELMLLLIHTFSVLSLQLKKLRGHSESYQDLSNANSARGHKEGRRSRGHIMVITRYSNQQGSTSRQNSCQVQPPENIGNLSPSRRCLWVRTIFSTVWCAANPRKSSLYT